MSRSISQGVASTAGAVVALLSACTGQAQLAQYLFTGNSVSPTLTDPYVTASTFGQSWGGTPAFNTAGDPAGPSIQATGDIIGTTTSYTTYYSFSLQASTDPLHNRLQFGSGDNLTFYLGSYHVGSPHTVGYQVSWSTDNVNFTSLGSDTYTNPDNKTLNWAAQQSVSLASLGNQPNPTTVFFRLYIGDDSKFSRELALLDSVIVNGTAVPEPAACAAFFGLGLAGFAASHRLSRKTTLRPQPRFLRGPAGNS